MSRRILLADDSVTIQKVIELTFSGSEFEVVSVGSGDAALAKLGEVEPSLLICDVHMPGTSGYEVCRQAKARKPSLPVLLLVGTFEPFDEAAAASCGADGQLKKPFDGQELQRLALAMALPEVSAPHPPAASPAAPASEAPASEEPAAGDDDGDLDSWDALEIGDAPDLGGESEDAGWGTPPAFAAEVPAPSPEPAWPAFEEASQAEPAPAEPILEIPATLEPSPWQVDAEMPEPVAPVAAASAETVLLSRSNLLAAEPAPPAAAAAPAAAATPAGLSDEDVERIARRVVELIGDRVVRDIAWEVVPDLAEVVVRDRLAELERQAEQGAEA